jgi:G3E family GTPase
MKITIVCGLLGSGKTTFIQNIASDSSLRTVVLVNDFGRAGIDGEIFSDSGIDSIELPSGCICCTLKFDLITTIRKIISDFAPEHLIIEPSGIASPTGVIDALNELGLRQYSVIGIVDAAEFVELHEAGIYGDFFQEQVSASDIVLINKIDLIDDDLVQKTSDLVSSMNSRAIIYRTVRAAVNEPIPDVAHNRTVPVKNLKKLHFDTVSLALQGGIVFGSVENFFKALAGNGFGDVVRAKALIHTDKGPARFDLVFGKISSAIIHKPITESRIVIIGENLDRAAIILAAAERWQASLIC